MLDTAENSENKATEVRYVTVGLTVSQTIDQAKFWATLRIFAGKVTSGVSNRGILSAGRLSLMSTHFAACRSWIHLILQSIGLPNTAKTIAN
jgi:hypothetical protein